MSELFRIDRDRLGTVLAIGDLSVDDVVLVDRPVTAGGKVIGQLVGTFDGGMSANLAYAAARVGADSQLCTITGHDEVGARAIERLARAGVDVDLCQVAAEGETWRTVIQVDDQGEKALIGLYSGVKLPDVQQIPDAAFARAAIVAPLADDFRWADDVARRATSLGALVAFDIEPSAANSLDAATIREILTRVDIVSFNRESLAAMRVSTLGQANEFLTGRTRLVIVLDGSHGAWGFTGADTWFVPALGQAVDTTGAGDAFVGAVLGTLASQRSAEAAMAAGAAAAAAAVGRRGARGYAISLPTTNASVERVPDTDRRLQDRVFPSDDIVG